MNSYRKWVEIYILLANLSTNRLNDPADFF
jgi:hypothetical protein